MVWIFDLCRVYGQRIARINGGTRLVDGRVAGIVRIWDMVRGEIAELVSPIMMAKLKNGCTRDISNSHGRCFVCAQIVRIQVHSFHKRIKKDPLVLRKEIYGGAIRGIADSDILV